MTRAASRLSQPFVDRLSGTPVASDMFYWDSVVPGFGFRLSVTFRLQMPGRRRASCWPKSP